jgi:hypothetical protein
MFRNLTRVVSSLTDSSVKALEVVDVNIDSLLVVSHTGNDKAKHMRRESQYDLDKQDIILKAKIKALKKDPQPEAV